MAGNTPTLNSASGITVTLAAGNTVKNLIVGSTNGNAVAGSSVGVLALANLSATATNGSPLSLTNGTSVVATGTNTLSATTGTGLFVSGVPILAGNLNFVSISSTGSPTGIYVENTGTAATQSFTLVVNHPPVAGADTLGATQNTAATALVAKLLANDSDADGDPLTVTTVSATSAQGGAVGLSAPGNAGTITYTPVNNFTGADSFTYTLSDGRGGLVLGTVTVTVALASAQTLNVVSITQMPASVTVVYAGIPGRSYQPQFAAAPGGPWTNLGSPQTAGTNGQFTSIDTTQPQRYYRAVSVP